MNDAPDSDAFKKRVQFAGFFEVRKTADQIDGIEFVRIVFEQTVHCIERGYYRRTFAVKRNGVHVRKYETDVGVRDFQFIDNRLMVCTEQVVYAAYDNHKNFGLCVQSVEQFAARLHNQIVIAVDDVALVYVQIRQSLFYMLLVGPQSAVASASGGAHKKLVRFGKLHTDSDQAPAARCGRSIVQGVFKMITAHLR